MSFFDAAYRGTPPWDIGRPQGVFVRLEEEGRIQGDVLDIGCGTGENALFLASKGHKVAGIDSAPLAIEKAKRKAAERGLNVDFRVWDAFRLGELGTRFDSAIDCGFFHTLSDQGRVTFEGNLGRVLRHGGRYFMLAFSEEEPEDWGGPRRVRQSEIQATFAKGWKVDSIERASFEHNLNGIQGKAWLSEISRLA